MTNNRDGKICLVTGTTAGIGKVTARELARMRTKVIMLCRDRGKGESVKAEIKGLYRDAEVDLIVADLSSLSEVRRAADEFKSKYSRLDILINNAGGVNQKRRVTSDGLEATFVTNYLSHFLLTGRLLELLKASAPSRVINVSSAAHMQGRINFDDLQAEQKYGMMSAYSQSKLAQIYFSYELADRLNRSGVTVNALHPGLVFSNFHNSMQGIYHFGASLVYAVAGISVEKGAETTIFLATSPSVKRITGKYFYKCQERTSSRFSYDLLIRKRLWEVSEELVKE